jgi:hypothetical protein
MFHCTSFHESNQLIISKITVMQEVDFWEASTQTLSSLQTWATKGCPCRLCQDRQLAGPPSLQYHKVVPATGSWWQVMLPSGGQTCSCPVGDARYKAGDTCEGSLIRRQQTLSYQWSWISNNQVRFPFVQKSVCSYCYWRNRSLWENLFLTDTKSDSSGPFFCHCSCCEIGTWKCQACNSPDVWPLSAWPVEGAWHGLRHAAP